MLIVRWKLLQKPQSILCSCGRTSVVLVAFWFWMTVLVWWKWRNDLVLDRTKENIFEYGNLVSGNCNLVQGKCVSLVLPVLLNFESLILLNTADRKNTKSSFDVFLALPLSILTLVMAWSGRSIGRMWIVIDTWHRQVGTEESRIWSFRLRQKRK